MRMHGSKVSISARTLCASSKFLHVLLITLRFFVAVATNSTTSNDLLCTVSGVIPSDGLAVDEQILLSFKREVRDPYNVLRNWNSDLSSVCDWKGVICDQERNRVKQLKLTSLGLEGSLTPKIGCLEFLDTIDITNNSLSGSIPSGLFRNRSILKHVVLSLNNFTGSVPDTIGNCLDLTQLNLGRNWLSGNISKSLTTLTNLSFLDLSSNQFTGNIPLIPSSPGGCSLLESIDLSNNHFQGAIPDTLRECSGLVLLNLSQNAVTGRLPSWLSNFRNLSRLNLSHNKLEGDIPYELFDLRERLGELRLQGNFLTGTLPDRFDEFILLNLLDLSGNFLSGEIPRSLGSCESLIELSLSTNFFTGLIPAELGNLSSFQLTLNLSNNRLEGSIPDSLGSLGAVRQLDLSRNNLTGEIPSTLGNCLNLKFLDLSNNNLVGEVPHSLCRLSLQYSSFSGNKLTNFGEDLSDDFCSARGPDNYHWERSSSTLVASILGVIAAAFAVSSVCLLIRCVKKPHDLHIQELAAWNGVDLEVIRLTVEDLLAATDNFSDENVIGEGSSGTVYKGVLPSFPFVIAVKKFDDDGKGKQRLDREATAMKLIRHRNLVRSLGARSADSGSTVPGLNVLVLEYMESGTLDHLLYDDPLQDFSWDMRISVAVDVAAGLCYLHEDVGNHIQIIHGDIKPGNIFLKSGFVASIGDFGLARLAVNGKANDHFVELDGYWEGTFGYCPPETGQGYMSTAGDVYSFGIVVLEMIVRRRPTSFDVETTGSSFVPWIRASFPRNVSEIIDCSLLSELEANSASVISLFKVGLLCTVDIPWERPTIKEALSMIESIPSRTGRELEVTASPIQELARDHVMFPSSAKLRNAQNLKVLNGMFDLHEFWIDIYDPSEKHSNACLSNLYRSTSETGNAEETEV